MVDIFGRHFSTKKDKVKNEVVLKTTDQDGNNKPTPNTFGQFFVSNSVK